MGAAGALEAAAHIMNRGYDLEIRHTQQFYEVRKFGTDAWRKPERENCVS
jgi:hypothetical protein